MDHLACAQADSAQFGVTVPKFRAPGVDIRKRGSKPLRHSEEHASGIRQGHKKASARSSRVAFRCWMHLSSRSLQEGTIKLPVPMATSDTDENDGTAE